MSISAFVDQWLRLAEIGCDGGIVMMGASSTTIDDIVRHHGGTLIVLSSHSLSSHNYRPIQTLAYLRIASRTSRPAWIANKKSKKWP